MSEPPSAFQQALLERAGPGRSAQSDVWLDYMLTTNERGAHVVSKVVEFMGSLRGRRLLDIGSGYGGVCVAAARAGAAAVGIELDADLRRLAGLNLDESPGLSAEFRDADAMDWTCLAPLGRFNAVTCDNVIEHVASPPVLLAHIRRLLEPDGLLYLTAPNAFSFGQITKECHYGQFGLSLLDPADGDRWVREALRLPAYGVSVYFRLGEYESLLGRYGLHVKLLNPVATTDEVIERLRAARGAIAEARAAAVIPASFREKVDRLLEIQLACCDADLAFLEAMPPGRDREIFGQGLQRTYLDELWYIVASPDPGRLHGRMRRALVARTLDLARAATAGASRFVSGG